MVEQRQKNREHNDSCLVDHVVFDDLPENCIFEILVRLPVETLCSWRFVCKLWFEIISSHGFRNAHLHRSDTTTRGLIFLSPVKNDIKFMELKDGKSTIKDYKKAFNGKIRAACKGLIVLERTAGLILHNPVTRELEDIPLGTISPSCGDLYGLAFCKVSRRYKLLHLFVMDTLRNLSCEIMDIGSGSWRAVDVPPTQHFDLVQNPIFAVGALHWIQYDVESCDEFIVSMPLDDEKFKTMEPPETVGQQRSYYCNKVFAMGEFLGYAGQFQRCNKTGVWILRGESGWEKQYDIDVGSGSRFFGLLCYGHGTFIFRRGDGCLYSYYDGSHSQHLRKIEDIDDNVVDSRYWRIFPHVNSLVSWRS